MIDIKKCCKYVDGWEYVKREILYKIKGSK